MIKFLIRGRKIHRIILIAVGILLLLFFIWSDSTLQVKANADNSGKIEGEEVLEDSIREQIEKLDLEELEKYLESLGDWSDKSVAERLIAYIQGEEFDYSHFGKEILNVLFAKIEEIFPAFLCIAAITLLSGLINALKSGVNGQTSGEMIFLIAYIAALIPLLAVLTEVIQSSIRCITSMKKQMQILFPIMLTLMSVSGGVFSASVCRPAVGFFCNTIVSIIHSVVMPITITIMILSLASNLTKELKIGKFTAFFKSINKWLIGVSISVFGIFFTLQGITAATHDGMVRRATKYAIGNGVPIVGGFLSGGFDLAVAGSVLIKNSLGAMGIFIMVAVLFEPIILLVSMNVLLRLTAAVTQPFGDSRISDFLAETADNLHYCTACLLMTAFLYFLSIILMIYSSEALF